MFILQIISDNRFLWFDVANNGDITSCSELTELSACPRPEPGQTGVVIIPGSYAVMTTVTLPKMRASEKLQAVAFALEEELITDPENIVVALGDDEDCKTNVCIIDKNYFETLLTTLHDRQFFPHSITPDYLALQWEMDTWTVLLRDSMAIIRIDKQYGFSIDADNLFLFLQLALSKYPEKIPKKILVYHQAGMAIDTAPLDKLAIPFEVKTANNDYFDKTIFTKPALNLLQGKYKPKIKSSVLQRNWMLCAAAAAAWLVFTFFSNLFDYFYYHHQSAELQTRIVNTYQRIFPGQTQVTQPRMMVSHLLQNMEKQALGNLFLRLLNDAGEVLNNYNTISIQSITYDNHELHMTIVAPTMQIVSQCVTAMNAQNLKVNQQMVKNNNNNVQVELVITS